MKKAILLTSGLGLLSMPCFATGVGAISTTSEGDSNFSMDVGYYYQRSGWEGLGDPLADDAMSTIRRDAPYLRLNYQVFPNWSLSAFLGLENISNDPDTEFLKVKEDLREANFGIQIKGKFFESDIIDIGGFFQYSNNPAKYKFIGEFLDSSTTLNQYAVEVSGLRDILVGATLQKDYRYCDVYGGIFYQDSSADVKGYSTAGRIKEAAEVDTHLGALLGANFHTSSQTDISVEYQNRGDHGIDISFTYNFK